MPVGHSRNYAVPCSLPLLLSMAARFPLAGCRTFTVTFPSPNTTIGFYLSSSFSTLTSFTHSTKSSVASASSSGVG